MHARALPNSFATKAPITFSATKFLNVLFQHFYMTCKYFRAWGGNSSSSSNNKGGNFNRNQRPYGQSNFKKGGGFGQNNSFKNSKPGGNLTKPDWESQILKPICKDFYIESKAVKNRSAKEVAKYRQSKEITVKGNDVPNPIQDFDEAKFPDDIQEALK
jgi:ATP-dependent RNA helicase DDX5/DBP2